MALSVLAELALSTSGAKHVDPAVAPNSRQTMPQVAAINPQPSECPLTDPFTGIVLWGPQVSLSPGQSRVQRQLALRGALVCSK
jgi:hypothetical protein